MKSNRKGQVSPQFMLVAVAAVGVWYGGYYAVKGAEKLGHLAAKPFHHHTLPLHHRHKEPPKQ